MDGLSTVASDGERWVAAQNILRFEEALKEEKDESQRRVLREMIEQERRKLQNRDDASGSAQ